MGGLEEGRGGGEAAPLPTWGVDTLSFHSPAKKKRLFLKSSLTPISPLPAGARPRGKRLVNFVARTRTDSKGTTAGAGGVVVALACAVVTRSCDGKRLDRHNKTLSELDRDRLNFT